MKKAIVITDLTRMYQGRVCIAGYGENGQCIRPVLPPPGIPESALYKSGKVIIYPFALVEFNLLEPVPQPPHSEDWRYDPSSPRFIRIVYERKKILSWSLFKTINDVFEQPIHDDWGYYVLDCQGTRSLGTIKPDEIIEVIYGPDKKGTWDYRLKFTDSIGSIYRLKITDLTWHYYCDSLRDDARQPLQIAAVLTQKLKSTETFLRIGLSRGWKEYPDRCYLQFIGIFTFPDFLEGRTFADLAPK